jgi:hypothetical protein
MRKVKSLPPPLFVPLLLTAHSVLDGFSRRDGAKVQRMKLSKKAKTASSIVVPYKGVMMRKVKIRTPG